MDTTVAAAEQQSFITKVYGWMAMALAVTAVTAYFVASSSTMLNLIFSSKLVFYGLLIGEVLLVVYLSSMISKMSATTATATFLLYAILNGVTFSVIFLLFTYSSIASAFAVTALTFAAMSIYGYTTKRDLTTMGNLSLMALFGIILSGVVNIFLHNSTLDLITSAIGIVVFVLLTAYDTQKIKQKNIIGNSGTDADKKEAIMGALILYLDFINLFLKILRFTGKRR